MDRRVGRGAVRERQRSHGGDPLFESVFQQAGIGIALVTVDGFILRVNPALRRMLGFAEGELEGLSLEDLVAREDRDATEPHFRSLVDGRRPAYRLEKRYLRKDGGFMWGIETASMVRGAEGCPDCVIVMIDDITEDKATVATLNEKDRAIRQAYVEVIGAVTGGKLVLVTLDELRAALGGPVLGPARLSCTQELPRARHEVLDALHGRLGMGEEAEDLVTAVGEAMTNALKHGRDATYLVLERDGVGQVLVEDHGPGIDFHNLPRATLLPGFSTTSTLGMGFTLMLSLCERVLLATDHTGTRLLLEKRRERPRSSA